MVLFTIRTTTSPVMPGQFDITLLRGKSVRGINIFWKLGSTSGEAFDLW